ncbi:MAG TPA: hypothetical protein VIE67_13280 [Rudaea sp.]|jgi:hypothetical protein
MWSTDSTAPLWILLLVIPAALNSEAGQAGIQFLAFALPKAKAFTRLLRASHFSSAAKKSNQKTPPPMSRSRDKAVRVRERMAGFA